MSFSALRRIIVRLRPCSRWRIGVIAVTAGIAAGLVSWIGCEWAHDLFRPRLVEDPRWEAIWMEPSWETLYAAELKNAALTNAVLGCVSGFAMGLAGGLAARAPSRGIFVGLSAQAVGLLVGALVALALIPLCHPVFQRPFRPITDDVWLPLVMHGGVWAADGAVGGAAFAISMGCRPRLKSAIGSATAGAVLAAVFFQLIGTCLSLDAGATDPVARWSVVRLVAMLLPTFMIAGARPWELSATYALRAAITDRGRWMVAVRPWEHSHACRCRPACRDAWRSIPSMSSRSE